MRFYHRLIRKLVLGALPGPAIVLDSSTGQPTITFPTGDATEINPAEITVGFTGSTLNLSIIGASTTGGANGARINWVSDKTDGNSSLTMSGTTIGLNAAVSTGGTLVGNAGALAVGLNGTSGSDFTINDNIASHSAVSAPRGQRFLNFTSSSISPGTTETAVWGFTNISVNAGRAYLITMGDIMSTSLSTNDCRFRLRQTNATGTLWWDGGAMPPSAAPDALMVHPQFWIRNNTGSDIVSTFVITGQASAGTATLIASASQNRWAGMFDVGSASDFAFAFNV